MAIVLDRAKLLGFRLAPARDLGKAFGSKAVGSKMLGSKTLA